MTNQMPFKSALYNPAKSLLITIQPSDSHLTSLEHLIKHHLEWIESKLVEHGAILFRGFQVDTSKKFLNWTKPLTNDLPLFKEESSPRSKVHDSVYTSTDYPSPYPIQFHNEYSYAQEWPMKLFFCCIQPSRVGGYTPISDSRKVLTRLDKKIVDKFRSVGVRYVRNFIPRWGVSWQSAFQTEVRAVAEEKMRELKLNFEWLDDNRLRTIHNAQAIINHPTTQQETWFNHAFFFNVLSLEPLELREALLGEDDSDLSTQTYYGDGSPIEPGIIEELRSAYEAESIRFSWQKGDLLLIDNMLTSHARSPYEGVRKIMVIMSQRMNRELALNICS